LPEQPAPNQLRFRLSRDEGSQRLDLDLPDQESWNECGGGLKGPDKVWICPTAPAGPRPSQGQYTVPGAVFSAWWSGVPFYFTGSYGMNCWIHYGHWAYDWPPSDRIFFRTESDIAQPMHTPVLADGIVFWHGPRSSDLPPRNLFSADEGGMGGFCIPRHGSRPNPVLTRWPRNEPLPGAINVSFFDGHGELVKLDRLWQLY
jgi:prepilin-type processing-associated H-X9-DG protein